MAALMNIKDPTLYRVCSFLLIAAHEEPPELKRRTGQILEALSTLARRAGLPSPLASPLSQSLVWQRVCLWDSLWQDSPQ
jgi:hypothetical protein